MWTSCLLCWSFIWKGDIAGKNWMKSFMSTANSWVAPHDFEIWILEMRTWRFHYVSKVKSILRPFSLKLKGWEYWVSCSEQFVREIERIKICLTTHLSVAVVLLTVLTFRKQPQWHFWPFQIEKQEFHYDDAIYHFSCLKAKNEVEFWVMWKRYNVESLKFLLIWIKDLLQWINW